MNLSHKQALAQFLRAGWSERTMFNWIARGHIIRRWKDGWWYPKAAFTKALKHPPTLGRKRK